MPGMPGMGQSMPGMQMPGMGNQSMPGMQMQGMPGRGECSRLQFTPKFIGVQNVTTCFLCWLLMQLGCNGGTLWCLTDVVDTSGFLMHLKLFSSLKPAIHAVSGMQMPGMSQGMPGMQMPGGQFGQMPGSQMGTPHPADSSQERRLALLSAKKNTEQVQFR